MINKKLLKNIFCYLLIFSTSILSCCSMSVLCDNDCKENKSLNILRETGASLDKKISEYLKKYDSVSEIMCKYKIGKNSVIFNDKTFKSFDSLKQLDENIKDTKIYINSIQRYDKEKLKTIKNTIIKLLSNDECIKKLIFTLILIEIEFGSLSKCSEEQLKNLTIVITDLITKRMRYILLTNNLVCNDYSFILKTNFIKEKFSDVSTCTKDFLNFKEKNIKIFDNDNSKDIIKKLESEVNNFFNSKKSKYTKNFTTHDLNMNKFLNRILDTNYISEIAFTYSLSHEDSIRLDLKYIDNLINKRILEIINKNIFSVPDKKEWENYYEKEFKTLRYNIDNIVKKDTEVVNKTIEQIKNNFGSKLAIQKIYLDGKSFDSINLPNVFIDNKFATFKHESTVLCTCKYIDNLLKKFFINIDYSNLHLKDHFKEKSEIESTVLDSLDVLSYSGKFNSPNSIFSEANDINDLINTPMDDTIVIVSIYQSEKELKKTTNYILYLYDYKKKYGFAKTGEVYRKSDKTWHPVYALVLVKDEKNNLITAHPRYISNVALHH